MSPAEAAREMHLTPDFPIATDRLRLRPLTAPDGEDLLAYRSLPDVCRFVPFEPMTAADIAEKLEGPWRRTAIDGEGQALFIGVELTATRRLIGDLMLAFHSFEHRSGEVGWVLNPTHVGQGYASEAARALLSLGFDGLGLHRIVARVDARNGASLRLCERLGMRREAHLIANEWFKGGWSDECDFAMLDEEWERHRSGTRASAPARPR